jgi:4-amino-4-deoxy-L-arabinose transferase-like glycosyltransferase
MDTVVETSHVRPAERLAERLFAAGIVLLIVAGIALRVVVWLSPWGIPEADEAVGGLMARHLFSGGLSVFYWGQGYGGPLEVVLAAPLVAIFGGSWLALRIVPILLVALTSIVIWRIGLRTIGRYGAITAAAVFWVFPSYLIWKSIHFHIFYGSAVLLGALALLLVLRLAQEPSRRDALLLGLVVGLGLWQSFQLITIVPAAVAWVLVRRRDLVRLLPFAVPGLVVGAVPVLVSNVRHSWWSLHIGQIGIQSTYLSRIGTFFTHTLPMSFDLRAPCTTHWFLFPVAGIALYVALIAGFLVVAWRSRGTDRELLVVVAACFPLVAAVNQLTGTSMNPVYVVVLMPVLALLLCSGIRSPAQGLWAMGGVALLLSGSLVDLRASEVNGQAAPGCLAPGGYLPRDFGQLTDTLTALQIQRVYASYWVAYRIDYETSERIIAADGRPSSLWIRPGGAVVPSPDDTSLHPRHPQYGDIVSRVNKPAWVIERDLELANMDKDQFVIGGDRHKTVGKFTIYWHGIDARGAP